jgi:hypothetical protein
MYELRDGALHTFHQLWSYLLPVRSHIIDEVVAGGLDNGVDNPIVTNIDASLVSLRRKATLQQRSDVNAEK